LWNHFIWCRVHSITSIVNGKTFYTSSMCQNGFRIASCDYMDLAKGASPL